MNSVVTLIKCTFYAVRQYYFIIQRSKADILSYSAESYSAEKGIKIAELIFFWCDGDGDGAGE